MRALIALLVLVFSAAHAQPTRNNCGPTALSGGPASAAAICSVGWVSTTSTTTSTATTTTLIVPAAAASDANCPSTLPTITASNTSANTLNAAITCATPAVTSNVVSVSFYAAGPGAVGTHQMCSVYTFPAGYVAGTTAVPKVAPGCDTVEWTAPTGNTTGWITLATTGACPLAASTRYMIACNQDQGYFLGYNGTSCTVGGVQCNQERGSVTYSTGALPTPWTANNQFTWTYGFYMSIQ